MPRIPSKSPATGESLPPHYIHTLARHFVDQSSRVRILRGVNLCGSSKSPVDRPSWILDGFWEAVEAGNGESFVGRPLQLTREEEMRLRTDWDDAKGAPLHRDRTGYGLLGSVESGEADVHLARLRGWGFTLLRFVFTWEALEHEGPGKYDDAFVSHLIRLLALCKSHGFYVYLDPHQDTWSRFTGGSGAPYWTLLACGINPRSLTATQSALLHNEYPVPSRPDPENYPAMIWGTNYSRLACQTLFTLFFAGRDLAPHCVLDGVNIQDWLQGKFIAACAHLCEEIKNHGGLLDECVLGWDSLNEPHPGLLELPDVRTLPPSQALKKGSTPTLAQSLRLGMGIKQEGIEWWDFGSFGPRRNGSVDIDPAGIKIWVDPEVADEHEGVSGRWGWKRDPNWKLGTCIWAQHGVWDPELAQVPASSSASSASSRATVPPPRTSRTKKEDKDRDILKPQYFFYDPDTLPGDPPQPINFIEDYFFPHIQAYYAALRVHHPELIPFVQPPVFHKPPWLISEPASASSLEPREEEEEEENLLKGRGCFSTHYYDGLTLMTRHWNWFNADALGVLRGKYASPVFAVKIGEKAIRKSIREQLGVFKEDALERMGKFPTVIGEIGIPMELDDKYAYGGRTGTGKGKGDYREQVKALDASLSATDGPNALSYTTWTYCPDNSHKWGDGWNGEDLSLWCKDDERTHGSVTGRRHFSRPEQRPQPQLLTSSALETDRSALGAPYVDREPKDRAEMKIREVDTDLEEDETELANVDPEGPSVLPPLAESAREQREIELQEEHEGDRIGYQVSSTFLTLSDLVHSRGAPLASENSTTLDPTSSRATLPAYTAPVVHRSTTPMDPFKLPDFKSAPLAFAFLTNGARAWKAFIRTYPLAVVGVPNGWEWDCQNAVFEMKVSVGREDRSGFTDKDGDDDDDEDEDEDAQGRDGWVEQEEPTVIFVPLVHFAKDNVVRQAFGVPTAPSSISTELGSGRGMTARVHLQPNVASASTPASTSASAAASKTHLPGVNMPLMDDVSAVSLALDTSKVDHTNSMEMTPTQSRSSQDEIAVSSALDLDITVSAGRYAVEGQLLKWWYPIPTTRTLKDPKHPRKRPTDDGKVEYTITIKRRGGPINFKKLGVPEHLVGLGPRRDRANARENGKKGPGWWDALCCGSCVIA